MDTDNLEDAFDYNEDADRDFEPIVSHPRTGSLSQSQSETQIAKKAKKQYRSKIQTTWNDDDIANLIKAVENHPGLRDKGLPEYKLPKLSSWQEVADIMKNYSVHDCKTKWNNLRVTFNTKKNEYRQKKSGQGTDESSKIVWKFFKLMLFLEASDVRQSTESTSSMTLVKCSRFTLNSRMISNFFRAFTGLRCQRPVAFKRL